MSQQGVYNAGVAAPFATAARWLKAWVTIGTLVVLVVIGYLLAIISALRSIDDNLAVTDPDVAEITGHVDPLPAHINTINGTLESIDVSLKAIPGQATSIIESLSAINVKFDSVDPTLKSISSGLVTALTGLRNIEGTLVALDTAGPDGTGLKPIIGLVTTINQGLVGAESDLSTIDDDLSNERDGVAAHVRNICTALHQQAGPCGS
jgi:hypothetical protein